VTHTSRFIAALALLLVLAPAAGAGELPSWPHEQQAMLRQIEDELLVVQRQLFKARQQHDTAALESLGARYRELQETRRVLIEITRNQLPSE
jgi:hypothetical protein